MSIQTFKKKGVITCHGSKVSGKPPGGLWVSQGPFGSSDNKVSAEGYKGFSINGGTRNVGYIGKSSAFSKSGTPYYGANPIGYGGTHGKYVEAESVFNSPHVRGETQGKQHMYIKPSILSTKGMLEKKYTWIHNGQYPNVWVQPVYGNSNLSDNASQQLYIQTKAAANVCVNDTNKPEVYVDHKRICGATGCSTTTARYKSFNIMDSRGLYTKTLNVPQHSSQYTLQVQRKCAHPTGAQKPFPFAVNGGSRSSKVSPGPPPPISTVHYLTPPAWYTGIPDDT